MGAPDWRGDETLDPDWNIFSERAARRRLRRGPRRNAGPSIGNSALDAGHGHGLADAYRMLFTKSGLNPVKRCWCKAGPVALPPR